MYASGNIILYTLSRFVKYRFMALGNLYGITSWKQSVTDIKAAILHIFAQNIVLWYSQCRCDNMVSLLHSYVLLRVLFFLSSFLALFLIVISVVFFFTVLPSWCNSKRMNEGMNEWISCLQGDVRLPDAETMLADVRRTKAMQEARFAPSARRHLLVEYIPMMDDISQMVGCSPPNFCQYFTFMFHYFSSDFQN